MIAQDRPGLLYRISSRLAELKCNIEIAIIDTEGEMAIDVFYLTSSGSKLHTKQEHAVTSALLDELQSDQWHSEVAVSDLKPRPTPA